MSEVKTSINDGYKSPGLSLVVVIYNMRREAPRTLFSLSEKYQQNISQEDYEVIVIDNGSGDPFTVAEIKRYGDNFRYYHISNACPSPARAMNFGAEQARGKYLGLMVDGARIASPNLLSRAVQGLSLLPDPLVSSLAFHLGKDVQNISVKQGYDKQSEDQLLENSGWKSDGYNLFKISTLAGSSSNGYLGILPESNSLFLKNETFRKVKGYDERFLLLVEAW